MARTNDAEPVERRWWSDIYLGWLLFLLVIPFVSYGCDMADGLRERHAVYLECARAKEITEQCRIILSTQNH